MEKKEAAPQIAGLRAERLMYVPLGEVGKESPGIRDNETGLASMRGLLFRIS